MLASGIGTWWFAMCFVDELILGIALFDICHDVQYNAIVWMYNRRLVSSNPQLTGFMKYLFRRGMVLLYLGLITAYGALGLVAPLVEDGTVSRFFYGVIFTSTILHYYYDGFIWKVREKSNQANLGLEESSGRPAVRQIVTGKYAHALKWSPAVLILGLLFASDLVDPPLTTTEKQEIEQRYVANLVGRPVQPSGAAERSWWFTRFETTQNIADAVPDDEQAQLRAAVMQANYGQNPEAIARLEKLIEDYPDYRNAVIALGDIDVYMGKLDLAAERYESALSQSISADERSAMNLRLGELELRRNDTAAAELRFQEALQENPDLSASVEALKNDSPLPPSGSTEPKSVYP